MKALEDYMEAFERRRTQDLKVGRPSVGVTSASPSYRYTCVYRINTVMNILCCDHR